jgi:hypothetical protein
MSLWRRIRAELAGAWRSVRYDLGRRPAERPDGPDVTSTGLSTFPGSLMEWRTASPESDARPPRRFVAVTALCLLAVAGAFGSYLLVTRSLSAAAAEQPEAAAPQPPAVAREDREPAADPTARMGAVTHPQTALPRPATTPGRRAAGRPATGTGNGGDGDGDGDQPAAPPRPGTTTTSKCDCVTPPVPTPTAPSPAGSSPDPGSPSPSRPPVSSASVSPSASASPSPSGSDDDSAGERRRRHRHWQKTG